MGEVKNNPYFNPSPKMFFILGEAGRGFHLSTVTPARPAVTKSFLTSPAVRRRCISGVLTGG
jgi:hypothetical protein